MKIKKLDSKGNIIVGTTAILIVALLLICIFVVTSINYIQNSNIDSEANDNFKYIIDDYSANLEVLGRESIADATQKVYNGLPVTNSETKSKRIWKSAWLKKTGILPKNMTSTFHLKSYRWNLQILHGRFSLKSV